MEAILVVEDDDAVRMVVGEMLAHHGYRVATAPTAHAALELVDEGSCFALVLLDLMLPDPKGHDLAGVLRERLPRVRIVYMSGFPADVLPPLAFGSSFIQKPFATSDLLTTVRLALAAA